MGQFPVMGVTVNWISDNFILLFSLYICHLYLSKTQFQHHCWWSHSIPVNATRTYATGPYRRYFCQPVIRALEAHTCIRQKQVHSRFVDRPVLWQLQSLPHCCVFLSWLTDKYLFLQRRSALCASLTTEEGSPSLFKIICLPVCSARLCCWAARINAFLRILFPCLVMPVLSTVSPDEFSFDVNPIYDINFDGWGNARKSGICVSIVMAVMFCTPRKAHRYAHRSR